MRYVHCVPVCVLCQQGGAAGITVIAILRFIAGLSLSNEAPAAMTYLTEHAPQLPCLHASLVPCSMAAGALSAAAAGLFFAWVLSPASLGVFGWRLVLVVTLIANAMSGGLRGYVLQDPEHHMSVAEVADRRNVHVWRVIRWVGGGAWQSGLQGATQACYFGTLPSSRLPQACQALQHAVLVHSSSFLCVCGV